MSTPPSVSAAPIWSTGPFYDLNGQPLSYGRLYTYQGSSWTVLQPSYTNDSGETAWTNPIVLDSGGNIPTSSIVAQYTVLAGNGDSTYTPPGRYNGYATALANTEYAGVTGNSQAYGTLISKSGNLGTPAMLTSDADGGMVFLWPLGSSISWTSVVVSSDNGPVTLQLSDANFTVLLNFEGVYYTSPHIAWTVGSTYTLTFYGNTSGSIYLENDLFYNMLLTDKNGNLINRQVDVNVGAISSPAVYPSPIWNGDTFFDNVGNVVAGGQVFTFNGSFDANNLETTYADADGTIPNPNPIRLSDAGLMEQGFFWPEGTSPFIQLDDIDGNFIRKYPSGPGAPGGNNSCGTDSSVVTLNWEASTPGAYPVFQYQIWRSTSQDSGFSEISYVFSPTLTYTDTTGNPGTPYYYYIIAVDTNGDSSPPSATQECSTITGPWTLVYTDSGSGNSNGSSYQQVVSDDAGTYGMATGGPGTSSSSDGGNTWSLNTNFPNDVPDNISFNGTYFIALDPYQAEIYSSQDLVTWTTVGSSPGYQLYRDASTGAVYFLPYPTSTNIDVYRIAPNSNVIDQIINAAPGPSFVTYGNPVLTANGITVSSFGAYPTYTMWYSVDFGVHWQESPTTISQDYFGLAYNGTTWLLVTQEFSAPYANHSWTSTDGINWTDSYSSVNGPPFANEVTAFNGLFLQWQGDTIYSSPDGISWASTTVDLSYIDSITVDSERAYVYGYAGSAGIFESTDGLIWTATNVTPSTNDVYSGGLILAASGSGSPAFVYKREQDTIAPWTQVLSKVVTGSGYSFTQVISSGNNVYATGLQDQTSTDGGGTWVTSTSFLTDTGSKCFGLYANSAYLFGQDINGTLWSSSDLSNWTQVSLPNYSSGNGPLATAYDQITGDIYTLQYSGSTVWMWRIPQGSNSGTQLINAGAGPNFFTQTANPYNMLTSDGSRLVTGFFDGTTCTMYYSDDSGAAWTAGTALTAGNDILRVAYGNGVFLAIGSSGGNTVSWTSTDGASWTAQYSGSGGPPYYESLITVNGTFICTNGSLIAYSADGVTWLSSTNPGIAAIIELVSFNTSQGQRGYIAGVNGIAETTNGSLWKLAGTTTGVIESVWSQGANTFSAAGITDRVTVFART